MADIAKCPYCKHEAQFIPTGTNNEGMRSGRVNCTGCHSSGPYDYEHSAVAAWNEVAQYAAVGRGIYENRAATLATLEADNDD